MGGFLNLGVSSQTQTQTGNQTTQKVLTQPAIDKIIYDVMSSDQGLAALAGGENASGGFGSSTKGLMAQDLIAKITGEIANITAPTVTTSSSSSKSKGIAGKAGTVICTELVRQGMLDEDLYNKGEGHFLSLHRFTVRGYQSWAVACVPVLAKHPKLAKFIAPVAIKRYEYIVNGKKSILGMSTVYVAQPICFLIGAVLHVLNPESKELLYGGRT